MVSIHAPARGATYLDRLPIHHHGVSIHAPRGVRQSALGAYEKVYQFQFTHPRGVRHALHRDDRDREQVSIHAPARGATSSKEFTLASPIVSIHAPARGATPPRLPLTPSRSCFNSRTREGCDALASASSTIPSRFQFTHPRGVRPYVTLLTTKQLWFQFTHPRGVRHDKAWRVGAGNDVSIHAPARGATMRGRPSSPYSHVSIHAPARGAT